MSVKCGNCHEQHDGPEQVRACFGAGDGEQAGNMQHPLPAFATDPATERQLGFLAKLMLEKDTDGAVAVVDILMDVMDRKPISKAEASKAISALLACPASSITVDEWPAIPAGNYALEAADGHVVFYGVDKPTHGNWPGMTFVNLLVGAPGDWREQKLGRDVQWRILERINADPQEAARLFGYKTRSCGQCHSPLSNPRSRAAGFGEVCAGKTGWPYPSMEAALRILAELGESAEDGTQLNLDEVFAK